MVNHFIFENNTDFCSLIILFDVFESNTCLALFQSLSQELTFNLFKILSEMFGTIG